jgi:hypothetical protein
VISFNVDLTGYDEILRRLDSARIPDSIRSMVTGLTRLLLRYSQIASPVRSGTLRRSGFMLVDGSGMSAIVGFGTKYAGVVSGGSVPHDIGPIQHRTLAFLPTSYPNLVQAQRASSGLRRTGSNSEYTNDLRIFPSHVYHPGTTANPFLQSGWSDAQPEAEQFIVEVGATWAAGLEPIE